METVIRKEFTLAGLCCPICADSIEKGVNALGGVRSATVDFANQILRMEIADQVNADGIVAQVAAIVHRIEAAIVVDEKELATAGVKNVYLSGLHSADVAARIEQRTGRLEGLQSASIDLAAKKLVIVAEDKSLLPSLLRQVGQIVAEVDPDIRLSYSERENDKGAVWKSGLPRIGQGVGAVLFIAAMILDPVWPAKITMFGISYLLVGGGVVLRAVQNIARGKIFDEHFLMSVATIGAFAIGEYPEGVAVMLFYQVGEAFQAYAVGRSCRSISALMDIRPDFANLKLNGEVRRVAPEEVGIGDCILVRPGERIPLDGVVVEGRSALDTSALTGEPLPRDVEPGSEVFSGSINTNGLLTISVSREFGESTVAKILDLVQNAGGRKARVENFITKFAGYYTPAVVFSALALAVIPPMLLPDASFSEWVRRALVFLVVSCPCALVISIPLSFFGGIGGASRNGILVKGSNYLEALNNIDTVVFDKTGTLTKGSSNVTDVVPAGSRSKEDLLFYAAHAEGNSSHPVAVSIRKAYNRELAAEKISDCEEVAGQGVRVVVDGRPVLAGNGRLLEGAGIAHTRPAVSGTIVYLAIDGEFAGYIVISDELKPDSGRAIAGLKAMGVGHIAMFTGDSRSTAERIGRELGLDAVYAELLPHQKVEQLEALEKNRSGRGSLVFVGDGINDAPVLARADVGIAMGGLGSDAAIEAADVVLMADEPVQVVEAVRIARKTRSIVWQNIVFALVVKAVILGLGALGIATMWEAVFGDVGVAVIAILNAMRAMSVAPEQEP
ncbi:MAG: cadmium-translocating P-type ATPase [Desulfovibrio sp.]|jgi:Cd2+/Zn2+-exporting ATPase|nr:cadmium-translocating P-type ATPase [Desulfovibrio sp.]